MTMLDTMAPYVELGLGLHLFSGLLGGSNATQNKEIKKGFKSTRKCIAETNEAVATLATCVQQTNSQVASLTNKVDDIERRLYRLEKANKANRSQTTQVQAQASGGNG